jgi:RNA polymerase sigma-70 factor (ECF subfamily)
VLATLIGVLGDIELAEEAAADAFAAAAQRWARDGGPANPAGRLVATGRNRAIDQLRRQHVLAAKTRVLAREPELTPEAAVQARTVPRSPMNGSSWCSPVVTRRSPWTRRSP